MNNRVPLKQQKPFSHIQEEPKQEKNVTQDFIIPQKQTKSINQSANLSNKSFASALKRSWQNGAFNLLNHALQIFPEELFNMDTINLDGEQWWSKNQLTKIDLSNNLITVLPVMLNLLDIQVLRMDSNKIHELPQNLFETLPNLKSLSLMKNNLSSFQLCCAPNIVELLLSENQIQEFLVDIQAIQDFSSLEILDLRQNQLQRFPFLLSAKKLKRLNLQQNNIQASQMNHLTNCNQLEEVLLSKNQISFIDMGMFSQMPFLKILDLRENKLQEFTQNHIGLDHSVLDQIILSFNQIITYDAFVGMASLSILLLNNNKIKFLPATIIQLKKLKTLDLTNNDLSDLPSEISLLPQLIRIQLEGNPLKCIRPNLRQSGAEVLKAYLKSRIQDQGGIQEMEKQINPTQNFYKEKSQWEEVTRNCLNKDQLIAKNQNLKAFDQLLFSLADLKVLDLSQNQFVEIPNEMINLKQLQKFTMSSNSITKFPFALQSLNYLQDLELSQNKILNIESLQQVKGFHQLRLLNLSLNQINNIPNWLQQLQNLRILILAFNKIDNIQSLEQTQMGLEVLDVSNNQICNISDRIYHTLPYLKHLNLQNNNLTIIPTIIGFMSLQTFQIDGNPTKTINRSIVSKGTVTILEYLRTKNPDQTVPQRQQQQQTQNEPIIEEPEMQIPQKKFNSMPQQQQQQQQQQDQYREINFDSVREEIGILNKEISYLENIILEDFSMNKFQKQEKKKLLQQKLLSRNQLQNQLK